MDIKLFSNYLVITNATDKERIVINEFLRNYVQFVFTKPGVKPTRKVWFDVSTKEQTCRLPKSALKDLLFTLNDRYIKYEITEIEVTQGRDIEISLNEGWTPRPIQVPIIEYFLTNDFYNKFLPLETGGGKTFSAIATVVKMRKRALLVLKGAFIEKWISDIQQITDTKPEEIMLIQGTPSLHKYIKLVLSGKDEYIKFVIISNRTYVNYINSYNEDNSSFLVSPDELCETLGTGVKIIDEVHLDFFATYKIELYTNCPKTIALSATLLDKDAFITRMYNTVYPPDTRYIPEVPKRYINTVALDYEIERGVHYNCSLDGMYSHHEFEKSVLRNKQFKEDYFNMINVILKKEYLEGKENGEKALIFVISIDMATKLTEYITKIIPEVKVGRYIAVDDYTEMLDLDIIISTPQNLGTGIDIPNLKLTIQTVNVDSVKTNLQSFGRLRDRNGKPTKFYYLYCPQIIKHKLFHRNRTEILKGRSATFVHRSFHLPLGGSQR